MKGGTWKRCEAGGGAANFLPNLMLEVLIEMVVLIEVVCIAYS